MLTGVLAGCSGSAGSPIDGPGEASDTAPGEVAQKDPPKSEKTTGDTETSTPASSVFAEVVSVTMRDHDGDLWFCTGALISKTRVVTAAHCLDPNEFESYEITAPLAPGKPVVAARSPAVFGGTYEDPANPDIGILTLEEPILLPAYAELVDVSAKVEAKQAVTALAVVRTAEDPDAPFSEAQPMPVSSTLEYGYNHGFGTPMFSKGGDSGAGLFLVENGVRTRKLIGIARQPEPDRNIDHFTRIDPAFLAWYGAQ